ncbi:ComEA family DNA-binding protein [Oerskovia rustica]|uniref:ComEA family DNA-binding protein n=1 Tax=Oerskovia rustica TaxID=2762237 RepID=UPI00296B24B7|nr:ComEA family DNA-binding protein [Oerskovia rustica]
MTFSRTRPPTADDDLPRPGGGDRLRRLRSVDPTLDPGSSDDAPQPSTSRPGSPVAGEEGLSDEPVPRHGPLHAVAEAYTAANGHPTTHSGFEHVPDGGPRRWSVGARTAVVAAVTVLLLATGTGVWTLADGDDLRPVAALGAAIPGAGAGDSRGDGDGPAAPADKDPAGAGPGTAPVDAPGAADPAPTVSDVVVHVVGAVAAPGLVSVPEGSRVADALTAAGDATPDADLAGVNLAREVVDGEQIVVPRPGEAVIAAPEPATGGGTSNGPVDLNAADEAALDGLSGIGPVLAARIVEWREANGPFTTVEELGEVSGIGDALLARLRDQVKV